MRRLAIAALVGLGALVLAASSQACSCAPISPGQAMKRADAAFSGRLLEVVPRNRFRAEYRYRVQRVYKSGAGVRPGRLISVMSPRGGAACGLPTRTGRRYGLLVVRSKGLWRGGLCGLLRPKRQRCAS